jgi:hypothetical protein
MVYFTETKGKNTSNLNNNKIEFNKKKCFIIIRDAKERIQKIVFFLVEN